MAINKPYSCEIGRLKVEYHPEYGEVSCCQISCLDGWNDGCKILTHRMAVEELLNLQYMVERALFYATPATGEK